MQKLPLFYTEGQFIEQLSIMDRSIHYGDGLFETLLIDNYKPIFLSEHLERLHSDAQKLKIPVSSPDELRQSTDTFIKKFNVKSAIVKILLTRGEGTRGYTPNFQMPARLIFAAYPMIDINPEYYQQGVNLYICNTPMGLNPVLAGIKHMNRLEQVMAAAEFSQLDFYEGLMRDTNGNFIEGTKSNVFIVQNKTLLTPSLLYSGVKGIMRQKVLMLAAKAGIKTRVMALTEKQLLEAQEVFICNSIQNILPVKSIMQQAFNKGELTKIMMQLLKQEIKTHDVHA